MLLILSVILVVIVILTGALLAISPGKPELFKDSGAMTSLADTK